MTSIQEFVVTQTSEESRYQHGKAWSEAHPLGNGICFGWPYDYAMAATHYHVNPVFCSNCGYKRTAWVPKGTKRPSTIKHVEPCTNCGVKCEMTVGRWG